jgi:hypothetical protein
VKFFHGKKVHITQNRILISPTRKFIFIETRIDFSTFPCSQQPNCQADISQVYKRIVTFRAPKTRFPVVVLTRPTSKRARKGLLSSAGSTEKSSPVA